MNLASITNLRGFLHTRLKRLTVKSLLALSKATSKTMSLTLADERLFDVIFERSNGVPVETQQTLPFAYPKDGGEYLVTLRELTVA